MIRLQGMGSWNSNVHCVLQCYAWLPAGEVRRSALVVIGEKGLNREKIEQMLAA